MKPYCIGCYVSHLKGKTNEPFVVASFNVAGTSYCGTCAVVAYKNTLTNALQTSIDSAPGRANRHKENK